MSPKICLSTFRGDASIIIIINLSRFMHVNGHEGFTQGSYSQMNSVREDVSD